MQSVTCGASILSVCTSVERPDGWVAAENGFAAAFVGVLDNGTQLLQIAAGAGPTGLLRTPAEIVLLLFRLHGDRTPAYMRGAFGATVSDGTRLWAFRDQVGFGTLFYCEDARGTFVATEAKQVLAGTGSAPEPDLDVLERIFYGRLDDDTPCALRGVRRLPKASIIRADFSGAAVMCRYWQPQALLEGTRSSPAEVSEQFDHLMTQAVKRTLTGRDVLSLSGGIDSCAVAAYAAPIHRRLTGRSLEALSAVFPDLPAVDESRYIAMVADYLRMPLRTYRPSVPHLERLDAWGQFFDGPVPTVSISEIEENYQLARQHGFRTILTGELGEFVYDMRHHLLPHLLWRGRFRWVTRDVRRRRSAGASWKKIALQLLPAVVPAPLALAYVHARGLDRWRLPTWIDPKKANEVPYREDLTLPPARRWHQQQLLGFVGPGLSIEADEMVASLCGVRVRRPLADIDLWEFFLGLPAEIKFPDHQSKTLVRQLLKGKLPDVILERQDKTVFNDFAMSRIDYVALRRWLIDPPHPIAGVHYGVLANRLQRENFTLIDWVWANDLARIHAFLSRWR